MKITNKKGVKNMAIICDMCKKEIEKHEGKTQYEEICLNGTISQLCTNCCYDLNKKFGKQPEE